MKKIALTLSAMALAIAPAFAQDAVQKAAEDAAAAIAAAPVEEAPAPKPKYWSSSLGLSLGVNNTALNHWAAGGYNTTTLAASVDAKADYKKDLMSWNNRLQLDYGFLTSSDKEGVLQKSNDRMYLESKWAYQTGSDSKFSYTASFDFRSQFTDTPSGYTQDADGKWIAGDPKSGLMSPAYANVGLGLQWVPCSWFNINAAPLTGGVTVVTNPTLRPNYGMEVASYDTDGTTPLSYKNTMFQFGAQVKANFKVSINDNIKFESQATVFTDYLREPYFRINWDNAIDWQLSKLVKLSAKTWMINDPNVTITNADGSTYKGWQFKEFISFAFTYTIASK